MLCVDPSVFKANRAAGRAAFSDGNPPDPPGITSGSNGVAGNSVSGIKLESAALIEPTTIVYIPMRDTVYALGGNVSAQEAAALSDFVRGVAIPL